MIEPLNRRGTWRTYSIADGLAGMRIEHIAEDNEGCLWFATWDNGASRFDGNAFQSFTRQDGLVNNSVHFISKGQPESVVVWYIKWRLLVRRGKFPPFGGRGDRGPTCAVHLRRP